MCIIDRYIIDMKCTVYTSDDCSVYTSDEYRAHAYSIRACAILYAAKKAPKGSALELALLKGIESRYKA